MTDQQPSNIEPYIQPGNPVTKEPLENKVADHRSHDNSSTQGNASVPSERSQGQDQGTFSSLGRGVQGGSGPVDATEARYAGSSGADDELQNPNVNAEQLATLGEGKVADAVQRKSGIQKAPGDGEVKYDDYASDLDRYVCPPPKLNASLDLEEADDSLAITGRRRSRRLLATRSSRRGRRALMWTVALRVGM